MRGVIRIPLNVFNAFEAMEDFLLERLEIACVCIVPTEERVGRRAHALTDRGADDEDAVTERCIFERAQCLELWRQQTEIIHWPIDRFRTIEINTKCLTTRRAERSQREPVLAGSALHIALANLATTTIRDIK